MPNCRQLAEKPQKKAKYWPLDYLNHALDSLTDEYLRRLKNDEKGQVSLPAIMSRLVKKDLGVEKVTPKLRRILIQDAHGAKLKRAFTGTNMTS